METFENGDLLCECGRAKTEVFKYDDVLPKFQARYSPHTIRKRYVCPDTDFFLKTEKRISIFEHSTGRCLDGQIRFENVTLRVDAVFLNTETKISVSKLPCYM